MAAARDSAYAAEIPSAGGARGVWEKTGRQMKYKEMLRDPRWQRKRLEILQRDEWSCNRCGDSESELHVHHKSYAGTPWGVADDELETVCSNCHRIIHLILRGKIPGQRLQSA